MTTPAPALVQLLAQLDATWPERSRASDGILGDASHQARKSDHNTGDALDVTLDEANGPPLEELAERWIQDPRVHYVIFRGRIRNRDFEAGAWRPYDKDPHDHHLHVSIHPVQRDDTRPWALLDGAQASATELHTAVSPVAIVAGVLVAAASLGLLMAAVRTTPPPLDAPPRPPT